MDDRNPLVHPQNQCRKKLYFGIFVASCGTLSMGSVLGYSSPAIPSLQSSSSHLKISDNEASWFGSFLAVGALVGCLVAGFIVDYLGRRASLIICSTPFIAGWLLIGFANSVGILYAGRIITGICVGIVSLASPLFISETSPPEIRGVLLSCVQLSINCGILWINALGLVLAWNWLALISILFPLLMLIFAWFIHETPRWLIMHNKFTKAVESANFSLGPNIDAELHCKIIRDSIDEEDNTKISIKDFARPEVFKPLLLAMGLMFFQQFSGINNIIFYSVSIFKSSGINFNPHLLSTFLSIVLLLSTFVSSAIIDRAGRRVLLLVSSIGMAFFLFFLGTYYYYKFGKGSDFVNNWGWTEIVCVLFYVIMFSVGYGPVPWVILGELVPVKISGIASSMTILVNWLCVFIVTKSFNVMLKSFSEYGTYWFFSFFCVLASFFVILLPETKGKTLSQISEQFKKSDSEEPET